MLTTQSSATEPLSGETELLTKEAYALLALLRTNDLSDEDFERLSAVANELDRRGVAYQGEQ